MKENNKQHNALPEDEYCPDIDKGTVCMLIAIAASAAGNAALNFGWYVVGILLFAVVVICALWIVRERRRKNRSDYVRYDRTRRALNLHGKEIETIKTELELKADKPARSNIRPGSRPSEQYKAMIGGEVLDSRRED